MLKNKHELGPEMRFEILYDLLDRSLSGTRYYSQFPTETRCRIDKAFRRFIKSIIDMDDMEFLSIGKIFLSYVLPLMKHTLRIEEYKLLEGRKNQDDESEDTATAESQTEEKQEPEKKESKCHFSVEIPGDVPEDILRKVWGKDYKALGEDFFQKLSKICEIIDK